MNLGKSVRLRRMFSGGRALVIDSETIAFDPLNQIRHFARNGADAVILTPGLLGHVFEDVDELSIVLRLDSGPGRPALLSVQGALEMGAEAVLASLTREPASVANFARIAEDARRLGMPLVADVVEEDWREGATLAAHFGADVIQTPLPKPGMGLRQFVRITGVRVLASIGPEEPDTPELLAWIYAALQDAAEGIVLGRRDLTEGHVFGVIHRLVHQGITAGEAAALLEEAVPGN